MFSHARASRCCQYMPLAAVNTCLLLLSIHASCCFQYAHARRADTRSRGMPHVDAQRVFTTSSKADMYGRQKCKRPRFAHACRRRGSSSSSSIRSLRAAAAASFVSACTRPHIQASVLHACMHACPAASFSCTPCTVFVRAPSCVRVCGVYTRAWHCRMLVCV